jgi:hypothetical protein
MYFSVSVERRVAAKDAKMRAGSAQASADDVLRSAMHAAAPAPKWMRFLRYLIVRTGTGKCRWKRGGWNLQMINFGGTV